jgi:DNA-binding transcriptional MerR regulator/methylmalonyl-CoA mutase cobalamin-binding subunit
MVEAKQKPTFNLKAVLQETGLKPDTLRAWERRYGLPSPERSPGGHRLYSQRDMETIKWLTARQQEGLSISRAVDLWRSLEADGQDPLRGLDTAAPEAPSAFSLPEGEELAELRGTWVSACLDYDERKAEQIISQAFALYPVEAVSLELLQKGIAEVGAGWYRGEVTVQQEHFASELAMRRLESLLASTPPPTRTERILVGCPPQENHTFSPLLLTLFLRRRSWDVVYLGANVPEVRMNSAITTTSPQLVIMSAQQLHTAASLLGMAQLLHERRLPLAYGGLVFNLVPTLRDRIPGHFLGEGLDEAPQVVERVLSSPTLMPPIEAVSEAHEQAWLHYRERQGLIEAEVWQSANRDGVRPEHLSIATTHLALNILAALKLGDMDFLGSDIEWVEGLLGNHRLPRELLYSFLSVYRGASEKHMDERGALVIDWLARVTEQTASH